jgi:hypothetical protein
MQGNPGLDHVFIMPMSIMKRYLDSNAINLARACNKAMLINATQRSSNAHWALELGKERGNAEHALSVGLPWRVHL